MGDWFYIFETFNLNFYFLAPRLARTLGSWMECGIDCRLGRLGSWNTRCSAVWLAGYDVWCRHVWWWRWPGPGNDGGGGAVTAGPGVTMEMWTLPQPGIYTVLFGHISTYPHESRYKDHLWNPSQHHSGAVNIDWWHKSQVSMSGDRGDTLSVARSPTHLLAPGSIPPKLFITYLGLEHLHPWLKSVNTNQNIIGWFSGVHSTHYKICGMISSRSESEPTIRHGHQLIFLMKVDWFWCSEMKIRSF